MKLRILINLIVVSLFSLATNGNAQGEESFHGEVSGVEVYYSIRLPNGYENSNDRYPVIYYLHRVTSDANDLGYAWRIQDAIRKNVLPHSIYVSANGYYNTLYADSKDGTKPAETTIIKDLVPYIEKNYRVIPGKAHRAVSGFSMGGYGAMEYAFKFPDMWACALSFDGALHTWETITSSNTANIPRETFDNDGDYFSNYSLFDNTKRNADDVRGKMGLRITVGQLTRYNRAYRDLLRSLDIEFEYEEVDCGHSWVCIVDNEDRNSWEFLRTWLEKPEVVAQKNNQREHLPTLNYSLGSDKALFTSPNVNIQGLSIYNVSGVRIINLNPNSKQAEWNFKDAGGRRTKPGIYLVLAETEVGEHQIKKTVSP